MALSSKFGVDLTLFFNADPSIYIYLIAFNFYYDEKGHEIASILVSILHF